MAGANREVYELAATLHLTKGRQFLQQMNKISGDLSKTLRSATADAMRAGFSDQAAFKAAHRSMSVLRDDIIKGRLEAARLGHRAEMKGLSEQETARRRLAVLTHDEEMRGLEERFKAEETQLKELVSRRQKAMKKVAEAKGAFTSERAEDFGNTMGAAFAAVTSKDIGQMASAIKRGGGGTKKVGGTLSNLGAGEGKAAKVLGSLGGVVTKLGAAAMAIGAIAGGLAAVLAIVVAVDAHAKELNNAIVDAGVNVGNLAYQTGSVNDAFHVLHDTFVMGDGALSFNRVWGTTAKDHFKILGAFEQAGYEIKEMTSNLSDAHHAAEDLRKSTASVLKYSKLLGMSTEEVAQHMGTLIEELGMDLEGVEKRFGAVYQAAMLSGFGTKRFFNMVLQATSGMSMYNVRLEEASGLLLRMGKILGSKAASDFVGQLSKGFMDASMTDRYKKVMLAGPAKVQDIFMRSADDIANDFVNKMGGVAPELEAIAGDMGLSLDFTNADALVKGLSNLSPEQMSQYTAAVQLADSDAARQLENLAAATRGATGSTADMAMALGSLDMGGKLAMQLNAAAGVIGAPLHKMTFEQLAAFESMTGISGSQLEELRRVSSSLEGQWSQLEAIRDNKKYETQTEQEKVEMLKTYGAYVNQQGEIVTAALTEDGKAIRKETESLVNSQAAYIQSSGDALADAMDRGLDPQTKLSQQIARSTTRMDKLMEQAVEYLMGLFHGLSDLGNWFMGTKGSRESRLEAGREMQQRSEEADREVVRIASRLSELQTELAMPGADREAIEAEMKALEATQTMAESISRTNTEARRNLATVGNVQSAEEAGMLAAKQLGLDEEGLRTAGFQAERQTTRTVSKYEDGGHVQVSEIDVETLPGYGVGSSLERTFTDSMEEQGRDADEQQRQWAHTFKKVETEEAPKKTAEFLAKELKGLGEAEQQRQLAMTLESMGFKTGAAGSLSSNILSGRGLTGSQRDWLGGETELGGQTGSRAALLRHFHGAGSLGSIANIGGGVTGVVPHDFLLRVGRRGTEFLTAFDGNDNLAVMGENEQGAVSAARRRASGKGAGGKGGNQFDFHFYNDGKEAFRTFSRLADAGLV